MCVCVCVCASVWGRGTWGMGEWGCALGGIRGGNCGGGGGGGTCGRGYVGGGWWVHGGVHWVEYIGVYVGGGGYVGGGNWMMNRGRQAHFFCDFQKKSETGCVQEKLKREKCRAENEQKSNRI